MSKLVPGTEAGASSVLNDPNGFKKFFSPYRAAELYSKYIRPSVTNSALKTDGFHVGAPWLAAGVGGAMLGGDYLQNKIQGN
jgi:hypothetical protein